MTQTNKHKQRNLECSEKHGPCRPKCRRRCGRERWRGSWSGPRRPAAEPPPRPPPTTACLVPRPPQLSNSDSRLPGVQTRHSQSQWQSSIRFHFPSQTETHEREEERERQYLCRWWLVVAVGCRKKATFGWKKRRWRGGEERSEDLVWLVGLLEKKVVGGGAEFFYFFIFIFIV